MTAARRAAYRAGMTREPGPWGSWSGHGQSRQAPYRRRLGFAVWLLVVQLGGTWLVSRGQADRRELDSGGVALLVAVSMLPAQVFRRPGAVLLAVGGATAAYEGLGYPGGPVLIGLAICTVVASVRGRRVLAWLVLPAVLWGCVLLARGVDGTWPPAEGTARLAVALAVFGLLGELARERAARFAEMRGGFEERSRRHASDERLRLAQELHDVLAHDVSLVHVQASTALHLFDTDPERARDALAAIKEVSHETLQELRATVSALRSENDEAPLRPAAGLSDLDDLAARSSAAGLRVDVVRTGAVRPLPARVELAAYRVAQEALTNARRHSGASTAAVRLGYSPDHLDVEVSDAGSGRPPTAADGHGITGMRERMAALGGSLTVEAGETVGYVVRARIPLRDKP